MLLDCRIIRQRLVVSFHRTSHPCKLGRQLDAVFAGRAGQAACFGLDADIVHVIAPCLQRALSCRGNPNQAAFLNWEFLSIHMENSAAAQDNIHLLISLVGVDERHALPSLNAIDRDLAPRQSQFVTGEVFAINAIEIVGEYAFQAADVLGGVVFRLNGHLLSPWSGWWIRDACKVQATPSYIPSLAKRK